MATDFQNMANGFEQPTSIMSVQVLEDGTCGEIRVVAGNQGYIDSIERPAGDYQMRANKFVPNSLYTDYVPRDLNFEDFCFQSAVGKKCLHSYVNPGQMPVWFNMTFLPVGPAEGNLHYCSYTMEVTFDADAKRMSNMSTNLASEVLETCIKLRGATKFASAVSDVLGDIRELCKAEQCCILLMDQYEQSCRVLCETSSKGSKLKPVQDYTGMPRFYQTAVEWEDLIGSSNCLIAKNEHEFAVVKEKNEDWYDSLRGAGITSIALFPLRSGEHLLGYIWACNFDPEQALKIKEALELTTFILGSEIANQLLLEQLKVLSSKDMLTGVQNRNEMNNEVDELSEGDRPAGGSIGVVFADLNGLKRVNDELGHEAGDKLLRDAAKALCQVFPQNRIYRAGGDEFTVILPGTNAEEIEERVQRLREVSEKYDHVVFAIGWDVREDRKNVRLALKIADQRMYEDKKAYYDAHPEIKKRLS